MWLVPVVTRAGHDVSRLVFWLAFLPIFGSILFMEIALRCGFRDSSGFSRRFRDRYGTPPSLYRRQMEAHRPAMGLALDQAINCG